MSETIGCALLKSSRADEASLESVKITKPPISKVKSDLIATKMAHSSVIKIDVKVSRLPHRVKSGKTAPNPTPVSDLEPLVKMGVQSSCTKA